MTAPGTPEAAGGGLITAALGLGTERMKRFLGYYVVANTTFGLAKRWYDSARSEMAFTVAIYEDDDAFPEVAQWVLDRMPERRRRSITAATGRRRGGGDGVLAVPEGGSREAPRARLYLAYDGSRTQHLVIDGHKVKVRLDEGTLGAGVSRGEDDDLRRKWKPGKLVFTAADVAGRDAVLEFVRSAADSRLSVEVGPRLYMANRWGGWNRRDDLATRTLDTVVLRPGQKERLVDEIARFLRNEEAYARLGMPWHLGILLYGEPGTGKTSIARALAAHFGMDVRYVPLSDLDGDGTLMELLRYVEPRSMLLLEDFDVNRAATTRDDAGGRVTMSGLLQALDGVGTPHGVIIVMTSNHADVLDRAVTRPGRADLQERIDLADDTQVAGIVEALTGRTIDLPPLRAEIAPVDVVKVLREHIDDPDGLEPALRKLVENHEGYADAASS